MKNPGEGELASPPKGRNSQAKGPGSDCTLERPLSRSPTKQSGKFPSIFQVKRQRRRRGIVWWCTVFIFYLEGIKMGYITSCFELIGTVAFALSGAVTGLKKKMDIFGVCALGMTTAVGGGMIRDLLLGLTPPSALRHPVNIGIAVAVSIFVFFPAVRSKLMANKRAYEILLLLSDSIGLGFFTVYGAKVAVEAGFGANSFLVAFVGVITGVGGGVMRDVFAGDRPYIFVKHIYACAAVAGAVLWCVLWRPFGIAAAMAAGTTVILAIRLLSAKFRWSLPKAEYEEA